jgi:hypothetical protein
MERIKGLGLRFSGVYVYDPRTAGRPLEEYLTEVADRVDVLVLLADRALAGIADSVRSTCFVADVEFAAQPKTNYKNYLAKTFSRLMRNLASLLAAMGDGANEQVMLLPFRNFRAKELAELRRVCAVETLNGDFENCLQRAILALKRRRRPRRGEGANEQHYVDNENKLFRYGHERHARLATGKPHTSRCVLAGNFRFGRRIPTDRHYNVTKEVGAKTEISGTFADCHDALYEVQPVSHLNIFSNDYRA